MSFSSMQFVNDEEISFPHFSGVTVIDQVDISKPNSTIEIIIMLVINFFVSSYLINTSYLTQILYFSKISIN